MSRCYWTAIVISLCWGASHASAATMIELRDQVTLPAQPLIRLQDVARISDLNPQTVEQLGQINLVPAPAVGRSVRVSFDDVRSSLQARGVNLATIQFSGQQATTVRVGATGLTRDRQPGSKPTATPITPVRATPETRLTAASQREMAGQLVQTALQRAYRTAELEKQGWKITCEVAAEEVATLLPLSAEQIRFRSAQIIPGKSQPLQAYWVDDSGTEHEFSPRVSLEQTPMALAIREDVPPGVVLRPEDLRWEVAPESGKGLTRLAEVVGLQTTKRLRAGELLTADALASVPLVRPNDIVSVTIRRNGLTVRRPFKSMGTGALQETVTLSAIDNPRLKIQGVVTGYHEATIPGEAVEMQHAYQDAAGTLSLESPAGIIPTGAR